jgi:hypothetical protein
MVRYRDAKLSGKLLISIRVEAVHLTPENFTTHSTGTDDIAAIISNLDRSA